jgi:ligand-binding SRPBCC domain-containing protein
MTSRRRPLEHHQPLHVSLGVQPLPPFRPFRVHGPIPPLPGTEHVGTEPGPPDHGTHRVSGEVVRAIGHHDDGTILSTYGQPFPPTYLDTMPETSDQADVSIDRVNGTTWVLRATQKLPVSRDTVFPFFADAANLQKLTPAEMGFEILTSTPIDMQAGRLIDYHIRLYGLPLRWRTLISEWKPPFEFVDVQLRGPYAEWVHRHRFTPTANGGTLVEDEVRFRLPLGRLGTIAAPLVKRQLRRIFTYRYAAITDAFAPSYTRATPTQGLAAR